MGDVDVYKTTLNPSGRKGRRGGERVGPKTWSERGRSMEGSFGHSQDYREIQ